MNEMDSSWNEEIGPFNARYNRVSQLIRLEHANRALNFDQVKITLALRINEDELNLWLLPAGEAMSPILSLCGGIELHSRSFKSEPQPGLEASVQFAWHDGWPRMLWRVVVLNRSDRVVRLERYSFEAGLVQLPPVPAQDSTWQTPANPDSGTSGGSPDLILFHNGWQSWSHAGWLHLSDRVPTTRLGMFSRPAQLAQGFPHIPDTHSSDMYMTVIDRKSGNGFLAGFLTQKKAFGQVFIGVREPGLQLHCISILDGAQLSPGKSFESDWGSLEWVDGLKPEPELGFIEAAARINCARTSADTPTGWCSWYYYFEGVKEADIRENVERAKNTSSRLPLGLIQIDDGFQSKVGDWSERSDAFPGELRSLAAHITASGFEAGIWLAPFLAHPASRVIREHPEWILRGAAGKPVRPGWGWNSFPRVLDITHPEVLEHLSRLIRTATREWGFSYLKLDFLYAGALPGQHYDPTVTRAEAFVHALEVIRTAAGDDVTIAGCGSPLGPAIGIMDAMRIGPDVAPDWHPRLGVLSSWVKAEPGFPAARNALRNTISRAPLHRRWWVNDPDCLILRREKSRLEAHETQTLATAVALSAGSQMLSDRLADLHEERLSWAAKLLPPLPQAASDMSWLDAGDLHTLKLAMEGAAGRWLILGVINLGEHSRIWKFDRERLGLDPSSDFHCLDFWHSRYNRIGAVEEVGFEMDPHGSLCLSVRPVREGPQWIGSSLHISQGTEVQQLQQRDRRLRLQLGYPGRELSGSFMIQLPGERVHARLGARDLKAERIAPGIYQFYAALTGVMEVQIGWDEGRR